MSAMIETERNTISAGIIRVLDHFLDERRPFWIVFQKSPDDLHAIDLKDIDVICYAGLFGVITGAPDLEPNNDMISVSQVFFVNNIDMYRFARDQQSRRHACGTLFGGG
jgi:hypothetical protein